MPTLNSAADIVSSQWEPLKTSAHAAPLAPLVVARPEFELIRACCHSDATLLPVALRAPLRWDRIFELATHHRVLPVVYTALKNRSEVPASIQSALRARYVRHCQRAMRFAAELSAIAMHLQSRNVVAIAQKGPALAQVLYGDSAMREFGDLDLLVKPADVSKAVAALAGLGYEKNLQLSSRQETEYLRTGYEYVFGRGAERNLLELQWNLLPRFYSVNFKIDDLFSRSQEHRIDGCLVQVLGLEDQLLFLCLHAAKHQWSQLGMIRDIAALAGLDLNWTWVVHEARRLGILRILGISILLAHEVLGASVPEPLALLARTDGWDEFSSTVAVSMAEESELSPESSAYFYFMMRTRERWTDRARFLWRLVTTPSVGEWKALQLPDGCFPLYVGVRILRLARRAFS